MTTADPEERTPAERRAAMAGFCSCKTGIHAFHRNNLAALAHPCTLRHLGVHAQWAQRLKRLFQIDIETCPACGGAVRIIACIEDLPGCRPKRMAGAILGATSRVS